MKHKIAELEEALLDAAVAVAEDTREGFEPGERTALLPYSTAWSIGGQIIERERITVQASQAGDWRAFLGDGTTNAGTGRCASEALIQARGETPLIAAMRCYTASVFGDEVNLPEGAKE